SVFAHDRYAPKAVLKILSKELARPAAHIIDIAHAWRHVDLSAGLRNAMVQLVILVADQPLVEIADAVEHPATKNRKLGALDVALIIRKAVSGQPNPGRV